MAIPDIELSEEDILERVYAREGWLTQVNDVHAVEDAKWMANTVSNLATAVLTTSLIGLIFAIYQDRQNIAEDMFPVTMLAVLCVCCSCFSGVLYFIGRRTLGRGFEL